MSENKKVLRDVLAALSECRVRHALIGGLAAGHYGKERATVDVDLLVPKRPIKRLCAALERRGYEARIFEDMVRVYLPGTDVAVADLVFREAHAVLLAASRATEPAKILGLGLEIVARGAFVALKYHAALSSSRQIQDRYTDVADIGNVLVRGFGPEDERLAARIVAKMYRGAVRDFAAFIDDLRHGRPVKI